MVQPIRSASPITEQDADTARSLRETIARQREVLARLCETIFDRMAAGVPIDPRVDLRVERLGGHGSRRETLLLDGRPVYIRRIVGREAD